LIIKELELVNFRSHRRSLIRFPEGKTLLEGDIGSGKSSVLMAVEFALFGLGSDSGNSFLRLGEDQGEVRIVFEVGGAEYEVKRRLQRRGGRVQQTDGELKGPTGSSNLSPTELKEKVLEILEFNEAPDPKAQSWIYRYSVYTPQEEMKSILALAPEQRLQILRRAFRIEDYKTAAGNAEEAARAIELEATRLEGVSEGVEELRVQADRLQREEEGHREELERFEAAESKAEGQVQRLKAELEEAQRRVLGLQNAKTETEYYVRLKSDGTKDAEELTSEIEELRRRLKSLEGVIAETGGMKPPTTIPLAELRRRERALDAKVKRLTGLKAATEAKLADYQSVIERGVCPVCERPAEAHDFDEKKSRKEAEREHITRELEASERELEALKQSIEEMADYQDSRKELAAAKSEASRLREEVTKKETSMKKLAKRVAFAEENLRQLSEKIREFEGAYEQKKRVEGELESAEEGLRRLRDDLIKAKERLAAVQKQETEVAIQIVAKDEASAAGRRLKERKIWLTDYFAPTVKAIEKSVLATINQEFDALFKRWFAMLVADPEKEVSVDDDFTPLVTQGGYEQDVKHLSGGERTSVALAYRLALNILARRTSAGMKSGLLILDEPTDGFSKEQLGSVREVLDEIGAPQVIIVSHDKELESFADQIFRVVKTGNESSVLAP
jgi:exonuclease SbcC